MQIRRVYTNNIGKGLIGFLLYLSLYANATRGTETERYQLPVDTLRASFSNPSMPKYMKVSSVFGQISIKGVKSDQVVVIARVRENLYPEGKKYNTTFVRVDEMEGNIIFVHSGSEMRIIDLDIRVPYGISLELVPDRKLHFVSTDL